MYRAAPLVAAVSCAVLTAAVAIPRAVQYAFWQDEVGAARVITRAGPIEMLRNVAGTELHPPGFYALGWVLSRLGAPAVWGRGISVAAAIALTIVVVLYAARLMPVYGAALAGLATALGWQFVDHSWELRPYSLFALVCVLFALALERAAERPSLGRLALLAFATAAGLMTHYFFAFTLVAGAIWLVGIRPARTVLLALGAGLVPLLMWAPAAYQQYHDGGYKWIGAFQLRAAVGVYAASLYRAPPATCSDSSFSRSSSPELSGSGACRTEAGSARSARSFQCSSPPSCGSRATRSFWRGTSSGQPPSP